METTQNSGSLGDSSFDLTQFYQVFFEEASENLGNMESLLLALDVDSADSEQLNAIFRCAHSIKGGAATFGFGDVADLTHVMETLLDRLRRRELSVTAHMVDVLLASGDTLRSLLARHQGVSTEVIDASDLVANIRALAEGAAPVTGDAPAGAAAPVTAAPQPTADRQWTVTLGPLQQDEEAECIVSLFSEIAGLGVIEPLGTVEGDPSRKRYRVSSASSEAELIDLFTFHVSREQVLFEPIAPIEPAPPAAAAPAQAVAAPPKDEGFGFFMDLPAPAGTAAPAAQSPATPIVAKDSARPAGTAPRSDKPQPTLESATLRVSVEKVDQLINLVGELVITQAMLAQTGRSLDPLAHQQLVASLTDLERNTRELQESVMAIRMIPMAVVFNRFRACCATWLPNWASRWNCTPRVRRPNSTRAWSRRSPTR